MKNHEERKFALFSVGPGTDLRGIKGKTARHGKGWDQVTWAL